MGTSIALINLVCGYTHADIEFILGKSLKDSNCYKLFIIDFDQVKKLNPKKNIDKLVEDDLEWPFTAEYYYPVQFLSEGNNDLGGSPEIFWKGYFKVAKELRQKRKMELALKLKEITEED